MKLYLVLGNGFTAGIEVDDGKVVRAAPILRWTVGRPFPRLVRHLEGRGDTVREIAEFHPTDMRPA